MIGQKDEQRFFFFSAVAQEAAVTHKSSALPHQASKKGRFQSKKRQKNKDKKKFEWKQEAVKGRGKKKTKIKIYKQTNVIQVFLKSFICDQLCEHSHLLPPSPPPPSPSSHYRYSLLRSPDWPPGTSGFGASA